MSTNNDLCPCGSGKKYGECCEPIIKGTSKAPSAEACMRARYSSYVKHEIDYIINSCQEGEGISEIDRKATEDWSNQATWNGLKILRTEKGEKEDEQIVERLKEFELYAARRTISKYRNQLNIKNSRQRKKDYKKG